MNKKLIATAAASLFLLAGCSGQEVASTKAGKIKYDDFVAEMKKQPQQNGMTLGEQVLQRMILEDAFEYTYGKNVSKEDVEAEYEKTAASLGSKEQFEDLLKQQGVSVEDVKHNIRTNLLMKAAVKANADMSDEALREFFDSQKTIAKVQHILVDDEETANEVIAKLNDGAEFKDLVEEYSKDPGSKDKEGMYLLKEGEMVPEFEEASKNLEEGETTQTPVQTSHGFHVIRRLAFDPDEEFESTKEDIQDAYIDSKLTDPSFMHEIVSKMLKDMNVQISDKELKGAIAPYVEQPKDEKDGKDDQKEDDSKEDSEKSDE